MARSSIKSMCAHYKLSLTAMAAGEGEDVGERPGLDNREVCRAILSNSTTQMVCLFTKQFFMSAEALYSYVSYMNILQDVHYTVA